jgi:hypothetical protein
MALLERVESLVTVKGVQDEGRMEAHRMEAKREVGSNLSLAMQNASAIVQHPPASIPPPQAFPPADSTSLAFGQQPDVEFRSSASPLITGISDPSRSFPPTNGSSIPTFLSRPPPLSASYPANPYPSIGLDPYLPPQSHPNYQPSQGSLSSS